MTWSNCYTNETVQQFLYIYCNNRVFTYFGTKKPKKSKHCYSNFELLSYSLKWVVNCTTKVYPFVKGRVTGKRHFAEKTINSIKIH